MLYNFKSYLAAISITDRFVSEWWATYFLFFHRILLTYTHSHSHSFAVDAFYWPHGKAQVKVLQFYILFFFYRPNDRLCEKLDHLYYLLSRHLFLFNSSTCTVWNTRIRSIESWMTQHIWLESTIANEIIIVSVCRFHYKIGIFIQKISLSWSSTNKIEIG